MFVIDFSKHFTEKQSPVRNVRISSDSRTLAATLGEAGKATEAVWWSLADNKPIGMSDIYPPECREHPSTLYPKGGHDYGGSPAYSRTFCDPVFTPDLARCAIHDFSYGSGSVVFEGVVILAPGVSYRDGIGLSLGETWELGLDVLALSPDGRWLLVGQNGGWVCRWDLRKVKSGKSKKSPEAELLSFAQDPEDKWDGWDADDADSLAVSVDGKRLATGHYDGEVRLFDFRTRKQLAILQPPDNKSEAAAVRIRGLNFSADDKWLAARSAEHVTVFDPAAGSVVAQLKVPKLTDMALHPDGKRMLTAGLDKRIRVWDTATWKEAKRYDWKIGPIHSVAVSPDGLTAAAGGEKNRVVVWDLAED